MRKYPITVSESVKNSVELVEQIKDVEIRRGEILVSFDVSALFPSVPVNEALKCLRDHLERSRAPPNHVEAFISVAEVCMKQNFFTFRGKCYKQTFGLSMGSKLSPLLAEAFMSNFETEAKKQRFFPRVWKRYVDDVLAVVKERYLPQTLEMLNTKHTTINFTVEKESEGKLPFLDVLITKKGDNTLKFSIYRKPTSTDRYITCDSNHFGSQKQAAFHSMAHRLYSIPMEHEDFEAEKQVILKAARVNGYDNSFAEKILRKHARKKLRQNTTTLLPEKVETRRISLPFFPTYTNPLRKILRRNGLHVVHKSGNTLRDILCNLKDKVPPDEQSGIYSIPCKNCDSLYIGQTRRKFKVRLREHKNAVENNRTNDSSVAMHSDETQHIIDWENAKLVKSVRKSSLLNAWESMFIATTDQQLMNDDDAPIISPLFDLIKRSK